MIQLVSPQIAETLGCVGFNKVGIDKTKIHYIKTCKQANLKLLKGKYIPFVQKYKFSSFYL